MSTESAMPSNHLILCPSFLLLPSIFPSIRVLSNESALHIRWPKHWSFIFSSSPSNEYSGLYVHHKPYSQLSVVSSLARPLHSFWSYFSALPSRILDTNLGRSSFSIICLSILFMGSQGKNGEVVCHSLLQWTTFS